MTNYIGWYGNKIMKTVESVIERKKNPNGKWLYYAGMKWLENDTLTMPNVSLEKFVDYEKGRLNIFHQRGYKFRLIIRTIETEIKITDELIL